jgi:hypothetical protein
MRPLAARGALAISAIVLAACTTTKTIIVQATPGAKAAAHANPGGTHHAHAGGHSSLPPGVKAGPSPGTYYVDCSTGQCTTLQGAGPFGTTCTQPSTDMQFCSPSGGPAPTPAPPATSPPVITGPVSISCTMGYVNQPAGSGIPVQQKTFQLNPPQVDTADGYSLSDYVAMQVSVTVQQDTQVNDATIVWYDPSGNEISSGSVAIGQLITAGQTLNFLYDESTNSDPNPPANATTCTAPYYD